MKWFLVALVLLVSCIQVVEEPLNETVYAPVVVNATKQNITLPVNISNVTENLTPVVEFPASENFTGYTIAQQHKMTPELESQVKNASCYNLTWAGLDEQNQPLEVKKTMRFTYLGGRMFKGWVANTLYLGTERLDSRNVEVLVEYGVACLDTENFTIDWNKTLARFSR